MRRTAGALGGHRWILDFCLGRWRKETGVESEWEKQHQSAHRFRAAGRTHWVFSCDGSGGADGGQTGHIRPQGGGEGGQVRER